MADLKKQQTKELEKLLRKKRKELQEFRFAMAGSRTRTVKEARTLRRDIARILTEINTRQEEK